MTTPSTPEEPRRERAKGGGRWRRAVGVLLLVVMATAGLWQVVRYRVAITSGSGDLWSLWDCDASYIAESRPNIERPGCMVRLPGVTLRHALRRTPGEANPVDIHTFLMGAQAEDADAPGYDAEASDDERPVHRVTLSPFWMQRLAVTVRQYGWCVLFGPCSEEDVGTGGYFTYTPKGLVDALFTHAIEEERPVTGVSWFGAETYCEWIGGRLPTEAEWEFGARGGALQRRYPWGDEAPTCGHAVFGGGKCDLRSPVDTGQHPPYGQDRVTNLLHQAGNVWEWTADWYGEGYYAEAPENDPRGPATGEGRVQRGGGWTDADAGVLRAAFRAQMDPTMKMPDVGFRCAANAVDTHPFTVLDDFRGGALSGWEAIEGGDLAGWRVTDGLLHAPTTAGPHAIRRPGARIGDTSLSARVFPALSASGSFAILYGVQDAQNHYRAELFPVAGTARLVRVLDGVEGVIAEATDIRVPPVRWAILTVVWQAGHHTLDFGNRHLVTGQDATWSEGETGLRVVGPGATVFDSVLTTP